VGHDAFQGWQFSRELSGRTQLARRVASNTVSSSAASDLSLSYSVSNNALSVMTESIASLPEEYLESTSADSIPCSTGPDSVSDASASPCGSSCGADRRTAQLLQLHQQHTTTHCNTLQQSTHLLQLDLQPVPSAPLEDDNLHSKSPKSPNGDISPDETPIAREMTPRTPRPGMHLLRASRHARSSPQATHSSHELVWRVKSGRHESDTGPTSRANLIAVAASSTAELNMWDVTRNSAATANVGIVAERVADCNSPCNSGLVGNCAELNTCDVTRSDAQPATPTATIKLRTAAMLAIAAGADAFVTVDWTDTGTASTVASVVATAAGAAANFTPSPVHLSLSTEASDDESICFSP